VRAGALYARVRKNRAKFGMIDAIILATANEHKQILLTFDNDFRGLPGVKVLKR
jgi:predicted nucleic acid-binding protein